MGQTRFISAFHGSVSLYIIVYIYIYIYEQLLGLHNLEEHHKMNVFRGFHCKPQII